MLKLDPDGRCGLLVVGVAPLMPAASAGITAGTATEAVSHSKYAATPAAATLAATHPLLPRLLLRHMLLQLC